MDILKDIKAVIFDMDGSLIDSLWVWNEVDKNYLGKIGVEAQKDMVMDLQKAIQGMSFDEAAVYFKNRFNIKDSVQEIRNDWNQLAYEQYKNNVKLKPGALSFLKLLREKGIKTGIATANSRALVDMYIETNKLQSYFDCILTGDEILKGKPSPDIYLAVAERLLVDTGSCLVFEDIVQGIQAGLSAGMKVCAVADVHSIYMDEEKRRLSHYYINDFTELL